MRSCSYCDCERLERGAQWKRVGEWRHTLISVRESCSIREALWTDSRPSTESMISHLRLVSLSRAREAYWKAQRLQAAELQRCHELCNRVCSFKEITLQASARRGAVCLC